MKEPRRLEGSIWSGMDLFAWSRLLLRNRFAVDFRRIPNALGITLLALLNTTLRWIQNLQYGWRIRKVVVPEDPVFIIGHWRSGTTMLHELMALDGENRCPTTYESMAPNCFLITEQFVRRWLRFMIPRKRPFDNMRMSFDRPQEDEIALCNMGLPSPFLTVAFPRRPTQDPRYIDLQDLRPDELRRWQSTLKRFYQSILFRRNGRLVVKSPQNTFRIERLLEIFPRARFIHIVRDPYVVFPSTVHFWKTMYTSYGLQACPESAVIEQQVLDTFKAMYQRLQDTRALVEPQHFVELRYEQLVGDPVTTLARVYDELEWNNFQTVRPAIERYASRSKSYKTNRYELSDEKRKKIASQWQMAFEDYGY